MRHDVDTADIQAIAYSGFGSLGGARYLLLRVADPKASRHWLRSLEVSSVAKTLGNVSQRLSEVKQVAFTAAGLRAIGVENEVVSRFAPEFVDGMAGSENRSRRLGDVGPNAPSAWSWGSGNREPHVLLMMFASTAGIEPVVEQILSELDLAGFELIESLNTTDMDGIEPFGFADGISQPIFDWDRPRIPGTKADRDYTNLIALGELVLGYINEYGLVSERPWVSDHERNAAMLPVNMQGAGTRDLGRNGTYVVLRQLAQDVRGFWGWIGDEAARTGIEPDALAELMVGRRRDGRPLADLEVGRTFPGVALDDADINGFMYDTDPDGLTCPIGAHVRRANPRTGDLPGGHQGAIDDFLVSLGLTTRHVRRPTSSTLPWPRNTTVWPYKRAEDDAIASARFHRILRRGREYGSENNPLAPDPIRKDVQTGLHFICLNANIGRQFEFVQGAWLASATFAGLSGEQDPLLGNREPFPVRPIASVPQPTDGFSRPGLEARCRRARGIPRFVTVRGGAYFFLPGLRALRWIASD